MHAHGQDLFEKHLSPAYYSLYPHRVGALTDWAPLAGPRGTGLMPVALPPAQPAPSPSSAAAASSSSSPSAQQQPPLLPPSLTAPSAAVPAAPAPSFMADVFFITQMLLSVGTVGAINRYRAVMNIFQRRFQQAVTGGAGTGEEEGGPDALAGAGGSSGAASPAAQAASLEAQLFHDTCTAALLEPLSADDAASFAVLQLDWLYWLAVDPGRRQALRGVPEAALAAPLDLMTYLIQAGKADIVASKPMHVVMRALVYLLDCPEAVRSPILHNKVVNFLLTCLSPQLADAQRRAAMGNASLAPDRMGAGERALVAAVLGTPTAQSELVPALMRAHVGADTVVGLDVDKDAFDKYTMRAAVGECER